MNSSYKSITTYLLFFLSIISYGQSNYTSFQDDATEKFGLKNEKGEVVIKAEFDAISIVERDHFIAKKDSFFLMNVDGSVVMQGVFLPFVNGFDNLKKAIINTKDEDAELIVRVLEMNKYNTHNKMTPSEIKKRNVMINDMSFKHVSFAQYRINTLLDNQDTAMYWIENVMKNTDYSKKE